MSVGQSKARGKPSCNVSSGPFNLAKGLCPARLARIAAKAPEPGAIVVGDEADGIGLGLEQSGGKRSAVDGGVQSRPEVDEGAEMILVPVGEHEPEQIAALLDQKADVGEDEIDAGEVLAGE